MYISAASETKAPQNKKSKMKKAPIHHTDVCKWMQGVSEIEMITDRSPYSLHLQLVGIKLTISNNSCVV